MLDLKQEAGGSWKAPEQLVEAGVDVGRLSGSQVHQAGPHVGVESQTQAGTGPPQSPPALDAPATSR